MVFRILLLAVLGLSLPAGAQTLDKIRKSGTIALGYIDGAAPFSFVDGNGNPQGYASGQAFLDATTEQSPDCVVLDLHMPGMTGLQLLRKLQSVRPKIPIVIITAHDEPETREQCLAAGACAYLRKPLEDRLLLNAISAAVGQARRPRI